MRELDFSIVSTLRKPRNNGIGRQVSNLVGQKFGRLMPLGFLGLSSHGAKWLCRCDCGTFSIVLVSKLLAGSTISCACYRRNRLGNENRTHGAYKTRLYRLWSDMHTRCYNPNYDGWDNYGGRGIKVEERWHKFEHFRDDVSDPPFPGASIDRYPDQNGNYGPTNFRWATPTQQARNKRNNRLGTCNGETKSVAEWSEISGFGKWIITDALDRGIPLEELFSQPTRDQRRAIYVTANGETRRIGAWSKITGIHHTTIKRNLDKGMSPEDAIGLSKN